jgi:hypothetical protein
MWVWGRGHSRSALHRLAGREKTRRSQIGTARGRATHFSGETGDWSGTGSGYLLKNSSSMCW